MMVRFVILPACCPPTPRASQGFRAWWKGTVPRAAHFAPMAGVSFGVYEYINKWAHLDLEDD